MTVREHEVPQMASKTVFLTISLAKLQSLWTSMHGQQNSPLCPAVRFRDNVLVYVAPFIVLWTPRKIAFIRPRHRNTLLLWEAMFPQWLRCSGRVKRVKIASSDSFCVELLFGDPCSQVQVVNHSWWPSQQHSCTY